LEGDSQGRPERNKERIHLIFQEALRGVTASLESFGWGSGQQSASSQLKLQVQRVETSSTGANGAVNRDNVRENAMTYRRENTNCAY